MTRNYSNIAFDTTLTTAITAGSTSITVTSATGYPTAPFAIVLDPGSVTSEEVVEVTAKSGTTWTVTRGFDGTTAVAHSAGAIVRHAAIAADFTDLQVVVTSQSANRIFAGPSSGAAAAPTFRASVKADLPGTVAYDDEANVFTLGQTIQAHSAIGSSASIDQDYPDGSDWSQVVNITDGTVTDLSDVYYSAIGSYTKFNPTVAPNASIYLLDLEGEIVSGNAKNFSTISGVFGGIYHYGSGTIDFIRGLYYQVILGGPGTITNGTNVRASIYAYDGQINRTRAIEALTDVETGTPQQNFAVYAETYSFADGGHQAGVYISSYSDSTPDLHTGLYIEDVVGGTAKHAIYTNSGGNRFGDYLDLAEISTPAAPTNTHGRLFCRDVAGKTQLCFRAATGAVQVIATEP